MKLRYGVAALAVLALAPLPTSAQTMAGALLELHGVTEQNVMATARDLSPDIYAFQPTDDVRTTGQILAHIANSQYFFCSTAAGEQSPNSENIEQTQTTKAGIVAALEASFAYCRGVYDGMSDAQAMETRSLPLPGLGPMNAAAVLAFNSAHNYEHYGNLVTYMRMNGIVPPSSR